MASGHSILPGPEDFLASTLLDPEVSRLAFHTAAEATLATATTAEAKTQAEDAKARALDKIAQLRAQWAAAKADFATEA